MTLSLWPYKWSSKRYRYIDVLQSQSLDMPVLRWQVLCAGFVVCLVISGFMASVKHLDFIAESFLVYMMESSDLVVELDDIKVHHPELNALFKEHPQWFLSASSVMNMEYLETFDVDLVQWRWWVKEFHIKAYRKKPVFFLENKGFWILTDKNEICSDSFLHTKSVLPSLVLHHEKSKKIFELPTTTKCHPLKNIDAHFAALFKDIHQRMARNHIPLSSLVYDVFNGFTLHIESKHLTVRLGSLDYDTKLKKLQMLEDQWRFNPLKKVYVDLDYADRAFYLYEDF